MKIGFANFSSIKFNTETPYKNPLGGSESAMAYLSCELAKLGHQVKLFCICEKETVLRQVLHVPANQISPDQFKGLDVLVLVVPAVTGIQLKNALDKKTKLILWHHQAIDQPLAQALKDENLRQVFDGFAFVSEWQMLTHQSVFQINPLKSYIMRNAVSPIFTNNFYDNKDILDKKIDPPIIAYTSTPFRGLNLLLDVFPKIRKEVPGTILRVYSSMKVYQAPEEKEYIKLYNRAKKMAGVEYLGSVSQTRLAKELPEASVLAYPNTFPETSSIAVMEAMASGLQIVTSNFAALPETSAGFANLIDVDGDWEKYKQEFTDVVIECLKNRHNLETKQKLLWQFYYANSSYSWSIRAKEWEQLFLNLIAKN